MVDFFRGLALVVVLCVAGCSTLSIHFNHIDITYEPRDVRLVAGDALYVEVIGAETLGFGATGQEWQRLVVEAANKHGPSWIVTTFTDNQSRANDLRYRLRVLFGVPMNFNIDTACDSQWSADRVKWQQTSNIVVAAFCSEQRELSAVRGALGESEAILSNRKEFQQNIGAVVRAALPSVNPHHCFEFDC